MITSTVTVLSSCQLPFKGKQHEEEDDKQQRTTLGDTLMLMFQGKERSKYAHVVDVGFKPWFKLTL